MLTNQNKYLKIACIFLAFAVCLGAFGAHVLKGKLDAYSLAVFEKAVFYHFIHSLGILVIPILIKTSLAKEKAATKSAFFLTIGVVIFSGSLYILAITGMKWLGAITPIGGLSFIAGWIILLFAIKN